MPKFDIAFKVDGKTQTITAANKKSIRAGSKNYWYATFTFLDGAFDNLEYLSASFSKKPYSPNRKNSDVIIVPIINNECQIPWEMLTKKRKIYVGVFAGDMLVTNEEILEVTEAAPTGGIYSAPTTSWYDIFMDEVRAKQDKLSVGENIEIDEENRISAILTDAVLCAEQNLTDEQKLQARTNIGAGTEEVFRVEFSESPVIPNKYFMITHYEEFMERLEEGKTIWARIFTNGTGIHDLKSFEDDGDTYRFWDIITPSLKSSIGDFVCLSLPHLQAEASLEIYPMASMPDIPTEILCYHEQELEEEEKLQARNNIGAGIDTTYTVNFVLESTMEPGQFRLVTDHETYSRWITSKAKLKAVVRKNNPVRLITYDGFLNGGSFTDIGKNYFYRFTFEGDGPVLEYFYTNGYDCFGIYEVPLASLLYVNQQLEEKANIIEREVIDSDENFTINQTLESDKVYWFIGKITEIIINLQPNYTTEDKLYHFYYVAGDIPPVISFPSDIGMGAGTIETLAATNTVVEVTISKVPTVRVNGVDMNYLAYAGYMETEAWR